MISKFIKAHSSKMKPVKFSMESKESEQAVSEGARGHRLGRLPSDGGTSVAWSQAGEVNSSWWLLGKKIIENCLPPNIRGNPQEQKKLRNNVTIALRCTVKVNTF